MSGKSESVFSDMYEGQYQKLLSDAWWDVRHRGLTYAKAGERHGLTASEVNTLLNKTRKGFSP